MRRWRRNGRKTGEGGEEEVGDEVEEEGRKGRVEEWPMVWHAKEQVGFSENSFSLRQPDLPATVFCVPSAQTDHF